MSSRPAVVVSGVRRQARRGLAWFSLLGLLAVAAGCGGDGTEREDRSTLASFQSTAGNASTTAGLDVTCAISVTEEDFRFTAGEFEIAGQIVVPDGPCPHGAVIIVPGSGPQTRTSAPTYREVEAAFLNAGFAVASWDKPGSGQSTGEFDPEYGTAQAAEVLVEGIEQLADRSDIDSNRIGLWGISEAGWVMPKALTMTDRVAFMIVVSGGGEDGIEQQVYQWTQRAACSGASPEELELMEEHGAAALKAGDYQAYRAAMDELLTIPELSAYVGVPVELQPEDDWVPWPRDIDAFFDPVGVIEKTTIPVLAIFGDLDASVDPIQGAAAYEEALAKAGNTQSSVELLPGVGHTMRQQRSRCDAPGTQLSERYVELLDDFITSTLGEEEQ